VSPERPPGTRRRTRRVSATLALGGLLVAAGCGGTTLRTTAPTTDRVAGSTTTAVTTSTVTTSTVTTSTVTTSTVTAGTVTSTTPAGSSLSACTSPGVQIFYTADRQTGPDGSTELIFRIVNGGDHACVIDGPLAAAAYDVSGRRIPTTTAAPGRPPAHVVRAGGAAGNFRVGVQSTGGTCRMVTAFRFTLPRDTKGIDVGVQESPSDTAVICGPALDVTAIQLATPES
jgi:hypothetical protein